MYCYSPCPQPCSRPALTHSFTGDSRTPTGKSPVGSLFLFLGPGAQVLLCPPRVYFSVLGKFWQLYCGVNGDILQEDFCHTHTQSPSPCGRPLLICTSTGNTPTQFFLSLRVVPGSWCTHSLFEPSEHLWQEQGLILNVNSLLLLFCWGFSFALGRGVSPHSRSSAYRLTRGFLTWEWWPHGAGAATCWEEIPHVQGHSSACASLEQPWRDTPCPRSGAVAALRWTSLWRYPMSK